jgi:hypothetical protein
MLYRRLAFASLFLLSLGTVCCSVTSTTNTKTDVPTVERLPESNCSKGECTIPPVDLSPKQISKRLAGPTWTYDAQPGWIRVEESDGGIPSPDGVLKLQGEFRTIDPVGPDSAVLVIMTTPWKKSDELFAVASAKAFVDGGPFKVLHADMGVMFGHQTSMVAVGTPNHSIVAIQVAVAANGTGHVIRCVGSAEDIQELVDTCMGGFEGFRLRNTVAI